MGLPLYIFEISHNKETKSLSFSLATLFFSALRWVETINHLVSSYVAVHCELGLILFPLLFKNLVTIPRF